jgi:asparagine synthase (glutamine-hydrolysing)
MCGIFSILNNGDVFTEEVITQHFNHGMPRGPETSKITKMNKKTTIGFHRLAINGLNPEADQPITIDNITLICNGEIYNYIELYQMMNIVPTTDSDCEVIIHLYNKYGIEQTLNMLDGVFAFIMIDSSNPEEDITYISRDPFGVRPMFSLYSNQPIQHGLNYHPQMFSLYSNQPIQLNNVLNVQPQMSNILGFASEMKSLIGFKNIKKTMFSITQVKPGSYSVLTRSKKGGNNIDSNWKYISKEVSFNKMGFNSIMFEPYQTSWYFQMTITKIHHFMFNAVTKRVMKTNRPVACLLSGGLDSSLVTSIVNDYIKANTNLQLETYSIGIQGSDDLKYAKQVADYLGTKHTEVVLSEEDFFNAIPEVIKVIESYDTTTVRASIGNYLIGKYISQNSEAKVIFNGDGSDEVCGGYLYMHKCTDPIEFDKETRRLVSNIHLFDVLRSDRCISCHGLEPRTPFLDRAWVSMYFGIYPDLRLHSNKNLPEKYLLRKAFSKECILNRNNKPFLPDNIMWRTKEAFSDGVSKTTRSLYEIIQDHIEKSEAVSKYVDNVDASKYSHNTPVTREQKYYRQLFEDTYSGCGDVIPYFWMPKYTDCSDSSARQLSFYQDITSSSE